jgi:hypothetical protein
MRMAVTAVRPVILLTACKTDEEKRMEKLAGTYVRTYREGMAPDIPAGMVDAMRATMPNASVGVDGDLDHHVLRLTADGKFTTEHSVPSLQQFDVPMENGTYRVMNPTTIVLRYVLKGGPDDTPIAESQKFTVSGDTLFAQASERMRMGEAVTSYSMHVGEAAYLLKQH